MYTTYIKKGGEHILNRKSVVTAVAVLTILGSLTFAGTSVLAQNTDGQATMITKLAQKLGVPETQVKTAFEQLHSEHQAEMKANMEAKLSELVTQGKITESQKAAIIAKMDQLRAKRDQNRETFQNLTPDERKTKMEAERTELENWAKSQGIDLSILPFGKFGGMMMGGRGGHGMGKGMGWEGTTPNQTQ